MMKNILNNLSIKARFQIALISMIILFIAMGIFSGISISSFENQINTLYERQYKLSNTTLKIYANIEKTHYILQDYIYEHNKNKLNELSRNLLSIIDESRIQIDFLTRTFKNEKNVARADEMGQEFIKWENLIKNIISLKSENNQNSAIENYVQSNKYLYEELKITLYDVINNLDEQAESVIDKAEKSSFNFKNIIFVSIIIVSFLFIIVSKFLSDSINHSFEKVNSVLEKISKENKFYKIPVEMKNEIANFAIGFNNLVDNIKNQIWKRDGVNKLSMKLAGHLSVKKVSRIALSFVMKYIKAGRGAIYIYDKEKDLLMLIDSLEFTALEKLPKEIEIGEGIIGQSAFDNETISVENIPSDRLTSYSLTHQNKLIGVLELGTKGEIDELEFCFLEEAVKIISAKLNNALQNQRITNLLKVSEKLKNKIKISEEFLQLTQDALTAHIAILDENGYIIAVNKAWKDFGDENNYNDEDYGIGNNYIHICQNAKGNNSEEAKEIAIGINNVLNGKLQFYEKEYPCHSALEERWFIVRVTKFEVNKTTRAVVAHENITTQRQIIDERNINEELNQLNEELRRTNEEYERTNEELLATNEEYERTNEELATTNIELESAIEELIRLQEELKVSDVLVNNFPNGTVLLFDTELKYLTAKGKGMETSKFSESELLGKTMFDILPKEHCEFLEPKYRDALKGNPSEFVMDLDEKYMRIHILPIKNDKGNITSGMVMTQDITRQKLLENELREANKLIQSILDNTSSVIYVKDLEGKYILVNKQYEELIEMSKIDIINKTDVELHSDEYVDKILENDKKVLEKGEPITFEEKLLFKGRELSYISVKFSLKDDDGKPFAVCGISTDISNRKQMEEKIKKSNDALRKIKKELEITNEYKSKFLSSMSHELRTPLNSILSLSRMMAEMPGENLTEQDIKRSQVINQAGNDLLNLINDILDLSKIEAGKMPIHLSTFDVNDLIQYLNDIFEPLTEEKNIDFLIESIPELLITSDKDKLAQILKNFLSNAIKFTEQGYVKIRVEKADNDSYPLKISIIDTGPGIKQEKQKQIFDSFSQLDNNNNKKHKGTGLGLAITKGLANLLDYKIELSSKMDEGSVFSVCLPYEILIEEGIENTDNQNSSSYYSFNKGKVDFVNYSENIKNRVLKNRNILIIDDDVKIVFTFTSFLEKAGANAFKALNYKMALNILENNKIDLIILDLVMLPKNGYETLEMIREEEKFNKIPVIICTVQDGEINQELNNRLGVVEYLTKPVDYNILIENIRKHLLSEELSVK